MTVMAGVSSDQNSGSMQRNFCAADHREHPVIDRDGNSFQIQLNTGSHGPCSTVKNAETIGSIRAIYAHFARIWARAEFNY
ncbi:MAG: hypothetical protein NW216_06935 [Hyphomicrobium sp.]|nr:hypothetical protein [Hyphomicrobium sp.]